MIIRLVYIASTLPHICGQLLVPLIIDSLAELAIDESLGTSTDDVGFLQNQSPNYTGDVFFRLYTRSLYSVGVNIQANPASLLSSPINPTAPTKVFVFGFENHINSEPTLELRQAYLTRGDYNFIVVDWSQLARGVNYLRVRSYAAGVANVTAGLLDALADSHISLPRDQHIIGHSLGAHIAGMAAKAARTLPGRCTGLDPAGPLFELATSAGRIDRFSAALVDIIHTAAGTWGISAPVGHIDFYANGGTWPQPDCVGAPTDALGFCSHLMSIHFFANTILHPTIYIGNRCQTSSIITALCPENSVAAIMGEHVVFDIPGLYYVDARINLTIRSTDIPIK